MSETSEAPPSAQPLAPRPGAEPTYSAAELANEWQALGCYPWDIAGVFAMRRVEFMTEGDFKAALQEWRTPPPEPTGTEGGF
jgi:hypothetical protein